MILHRSSEGSGGNESRFRLTVLGRTELRRADGTEVRSVLRQPKRLALLVYLALARPQGFHRRDALLALLWPDSDATHARGALRQSLVYLRRALGEDVLLSRGSQEVGLHAGLLTCDATSFKAAVSEARLADAVDLYQGGLLDGLHLSDAPEFERWLDEERQHLRRQALEATRALADRAVTSDRREEAAHWLRRALALDPFDEHAAQALIRLLDRTGDRAGALKEYQQFAARLARDLELDAAPETHALAESISAREREWVHSRIEPAEPSKVSSTELATERDPAEQTFWLHRFRPRARTLLAIAGTALALGAGVVVVAALSDGDRPDAEGTVDTAGEKRVAPAPGGSALIPHRVVVLPFENLTRDSALDPLGRVAADWISRGLGRVGRIEVVPFELVLEHSAQDTMGALAARLAAEMNAGLVVAGTVYGRPDRLYLEARVTDLAAGRTLPSVEALPLDPAGPLDAVRQARERVMGVVASWIAPETAPFTTHYAAPPRYDSYVSYVELLEEYTTRRSNPALIDPMREVWRRDTTFVDPLLLALRIALNANRVHTADTLLARLEGLRPLLSPAYRHYLESQKARRRGDARGRYAALQRSVAIDPMLFGEQYGHAAFWLGYYREAVRWWQRMPLQRLSHFKALQAGLHFLGEHEAEASAMREAQRLRPHDPMLIAWEMEALAAMGRLEELESALGRFEATPLGREPLGGMLMVLGQELLLHGHVEHAHDLWNRARKSFEADTVRARRISALAWIEYLSGRMAEAHTLYGELSHYTDPDSRILGQLGVTAARLGDRRTALEISSRIAELQEVWGRAEFSQATVAAALGDRDEALRLLRKATARGFPHFYFHRMGIEFRRFLDDPTFREFFEPKG